jgi:hypothetical protein
MADMAAARYLKRQLIGHDQQASTGMRRGTASRQSGRREKPPKAGLRLWSLLLCVAALVLGSPAALQAQMFQTIAPLSFTKAFAGADPLPQVITVASTDPTSTIDFTAIAVNSAGNNWLSVSGGGTFNAGTTPQAITVAVKPGATMGSGTYTAQINVKSTDGKKSLVVPVSLIVSPASSASFAESGGALTFSMAKSGNAPPKQTVDIANEGSGTLNWTASGTTADGGNWLTLSPISGTAPSALSIGVVPSKLPFGGLVSGSFVGQVALNTAGERATIPVTVTVGTSVFEQVNALSFTMTYGGAAPLPQVFTVASTDLPIDFTASAANPSGSGLVSVSGGGTFNPGTTPQAITVSISPAMNQPVGTYTSEVIVKSTDGTESMLVPVTLTVQPSTATYFDKTQGALTFSMTPSGIAPQAQTMLIRNVGLSTLTWSGIAITADGGDWLSLSPVQGTAPSTALVSVNPANLPHNGLLPGAFTGLVTLQAASGNVSVPVTYTIASSVFQQVPALSFSKAYGGANPASQVFTVASMGANLTFTAAAANSTGGWLKVAGGGTFNPAITPQTITVTAQPDTALPIGVYTAEIIVKTTDGTEPMVIPVTLTIGSNTQAATTPTFSPGGGTYASAQSVTISSATTGSAIYYTTDGSQPTVRSALYSGPVQVTASGTLNAIAVASGYTGSAVAGATYSIAGGQCVVIDNSSGFTGTGLTLNGGATVTGNLLQLTDGGFDEARSAFTSARVPIDSFVTDFTFHLLDAYAEGFTFTIQGDGPQAVGAAGGGLGYQGIPNSAALKIDLFDTAGEGYDSTGIYLNGAAPTVPATDLGQAGIDLHNGHVFAVHLANVNGVYAGSITDTVTGVSSSIYVQGYGVPAGSMAFVGFTAGTSAEGSATQNILTWKYQGGTACGH